MTVILPSAGWSDELDQEIERSAELLRDLRHLRDHTTPPRSVLERAPLLDGWSPAIRSVACLVGRPHGHPRLSGRRPAATSPLRVISLEDGFARTESRFYRLGRPATETTDA
ncbi:DUF6634 family protein [Aureimonas jatrophae]|uniref:Uncharacterized protein n=1 Tax=Aureimonas jatrophae TaxID=1166073 RepID=A0A1H0MKS1_9HYPH|nr:DUF6634 family protein [Aureimonas jatrophae]MBB3952919.1 hypothetical protein [Aureimonas jatrophae]SDO80740.1 hypothetical protein SAMN05192530_11437 [Aureimonas jatrophae]